MAKLDHTVYIDSFIDGGIFTYNLWRSVGSHDCGKLVVSHKLYERFNLERMAHVSK